MTDFELDSRLARDTDLVADLPLCALRVMKDANYRWLVLVPRQPGIVEVLDLAPADRARMWAEIEMAADILKHSTRCAKLNIATLGNVVSQLHIHIVARNPGDPAWPAPVWGKAPPAPYRPADLEAFVEAVRARLPAP